MRAESSEKPGIREQHALRRRNNPLFDETRRNVANEDLASARLDDGLELDHFMEEFQLLVQRAIDLKPNTPSETVLEIKAALDKSYQQACALPGDQTQVKQAISQLVNAIMRAIRNGIDSDALAEQELEDEETARRAHFSLQELPLVSALTHPESPIGENELIPSLLSEPEQTLAPSLTIFDKGQMEVLCEDARAFLSQLDPDRALDEAWRRLELMEEIFHQSHQPQRGDH
ncbi:hypothetical protein DFR30_1630 [Thiogranum longum]|uniref:Uncharacterized protein n=1 Tax=Thiogranum longum TaxID=1537524 RepID=A0A4R1HM91_9GAMM|nr:hypothetical protein [Thiogranum longum]TCK18352.1 hypothetical protein DFR30_1630 [Thiogranum longum]